MQRRACVELCDTLMKKFLLLCLALSNSLSAQIFQANGTISTGWGAITAWYSLIHYTPNEVAQQVVYLANLLDEEGILAVALHAGAAVETTDEWLGHEVSTPWVRHDPAQVRAAFAAAGLVEIEAYVEVGEDTDRLFVLAQRP